MEWIRPTGHSRPDVWESPTDFEDPDTAWIDEDKAYDEDLGTYALSDEIGETYSSWLVLTRATAFVCDKVRFYVKFAEYTKKAKIDIYYGGDWHNVYENTNITEEGRWYEASFGTQLIRKARIAIAAAPTYSQYLFEFDFGKTWTDETDAYDGNTGTYAQYPIVGGVWSEFLELTLPSAIPSDKVRFWATASYYEIEQIDVDVYKDGEWVHVFQGDISEVNDQWVEKTFARGSVTKARVRLWDTFTYTGRLHEFEFWKLVIGPFPTFFRPA